MDEWRYIDSGRGSAAWNMAVDEALLHSFKEDDRPILRLYRWEKPALSFGRFSDPEKTLDWKKIQTENIPYTRRITGGGILVHGSDISYSLIVPRIFFVNRSIKEGYRYLCSFLIRFYHNLGLNASFACDQQFTEKHSSVCLAGTEAYDIVIDGKKIGGNAQRHTHQTILQHGTIPLTLARKYFEVLFLEDSGLAEAAALKNSHIDISEEKLTEKLLEAFRETFDGTLSKDSLGYEEQKLAQKLLNEKYTGEAWNVHAKDTSKQA